jgi:hypothetical protein
LQEAGDGGFISPLKHHYPAMAAGVTDRPWEMSDVVALLDRELEQRVQASRDKAKLNNERSYNPSGPAPDQ